MARGRRRKVVQKDSSGGSRIFKTRQSSMRVNLSYISNLTDSGHGSLKKTNIDSDENASEESIVQNNNLSHSKTARPCMNDDTATSASTVNVTVINAGNRSSPIANHNLLDEAQNNSLKIIKEKEQQLNKTCMQLKDAIINKTQALFDRENELAIKTSEVLASGSSSLINRETEASDKRSPSIKVNIGKNEQIIMSGDGRKRYPVQVNSMGNDEALEGQSQKADEDDFDCNHSIISTPKKLRTESFKSGKVFCNKTSDTIVRIPVVRLFAEDSDPNNSLSELNPLNINNPKRTELDAEANKNNTNSSPKAPNQLNYTTSPILSQGRRSRISCLSLKKKLTKRLTQNNLRLTQNTSRLSSSTATESFINRNPLTCSSFVERQEKVNENENKNKTVDLAEKSEMSNNCKTINLDDNEKTSETIEITNSINQSCMEITTVSSQMPIVRRSFQQVIRRSLQLDKIVTIVNQNENSNKEINIDQENCSNNTVYTSLSVNTSLDQISLADHIAQKENKKPNTMEVIENKDGTDQVEEDDTLIIQRGSSNSIRSSMQVNTSLDSIRKSLVPNSITQEQEKNDRIVFQQPSNSTNQDKESIDRIGSRQSIISMIIEKENSDIIASRPSTSTIRTSMQVNTSLDSAKKSPITKNLLDFNQILSMVEETTTNDHQSKISERSSESHSSGSDSDLENVSLIERIRNISATKRTDTFKDPNLAMVKKTKKSTETENNTSNKKRKSTGDKIINSNATRKSARLEHSSTNTGKESARVSTGSVRRSIEVENLSSTTNESSVVETTPYPTSRSVLMKTMIKNSIAMNTLDPKKFVDLSDNEDSNSESEITNDKKKSPSPNKYQSVYARKKTPSPKIIDNIVVDSSDESSDASSKRKRPIIIDKSLNDTRGHKKKNDADSKDQRENKKTVSKRKLYLLKDNSQLISFSPADIQEPQEETETKNTKKRKKRKAAQKKKQERKRSVRSPELEPVNESEPFENEILPKKVTKIKKKPRKINSKKIVVKKVTNLTLLDKMMDNEELLSQRLSERNSLREFDLRRIKSRRKENTHNHKIIIVATGLTTEERDLLKSVIKALGSATLELNVTPRTTHVISPGTRTINLLKGILRGCWLLSLEWALKSLESGKWLDPSPYEMVHFAKAVQENRRDRQLFGKAYVPELFVTCGFIYVENGTSPPASVLKELVKTAGGRITEDANKAEIIIGSEGLKEIWILDSITTGEVQPIEEYKQN